ncbi:hypothetical protein PCASD_20064 [Puccinia coronata f. sp. avenae]|uniref:Uncharacterized protein n=1 Tax=Puccinia coronata f. sp. avenae TaxID=200324 RepID=A0A2N5TTQ2_9BASI|nr:hypothetical protein PCASD_20064 [Puccinia coronata f. sp. avenae]
MLPRVPGTEASSIGWKITDSTLNRFHRLTSTDVNFPLDDPLERRAATTQGRGGKRQTRKEPASPHSMTLFNRKSNQTSDPNNNTTAKDKQKWSRRPAKKKIPSQGLAAHLDPKNRPPIFFLNCITFAPLGGILLWGSSKVHEFTIDYTNCDTDAPQVPAGGDTNNGFQNLPSDKYGYHFALAVPPRGSQRGSFRLTTPSAKPAASSVSDSLKQLLDQSRQLHAGIASASSLNPNAGFNQFSGTPNSSSNLNVTLPTVQLGLDQIEAQSRRLVSKIRKNDTLDASLSLFGGGEHHLVPGEMAEVSLL